MRAGVRRQSFLHVGARQCAHRPLAAILGWIHYLIFDLFIGAWESRDAQRRGIPHWAVIPCLLVTLLAGPIGLLVYLGLRAALGRGGVLLAEQP